MNCFCVLFCFVSFRFGWIVDTLTILSGNNEISLIAILCRSLDHTILHSRIPRCLPFRLPPTLVSVIQNSIIILFYQDDSSSMTRTSSINRGTCHQQRFESMWYRTAIRSLSHSYTKKVHDGLKTKERGVYDRSHVVLEVGGVRRITHAFTYVRGWDGSRYCCNLFSIRQHTTLRQ